MKAGSSTEERKLSVCFVCMGNICRSPTAQGVFRQLVTSRGLGAHFLIDSCGTHAYHVGNRPDHRAMAAAGRRGVDIAGLRARQVTEEDFWRFDFLLAMDEANLAALRARQPAAATARLDLLLTFAPHLNVREVPDPYYGGEQGFEAVLNLIEHAAAGLLHHIEQEVFKRGR